MTAAEYLEQLMCRAKKDPKLRQRLLDTRKEDNPLSAFCGGVPGTGISFV